MENHRIEIAHHNRTVRGICTFPDGNGKSPIVLLSHGYNSTQECFEKFGGYLASQGIASLRFDFCGGANSSASSMATTDMTIFTEVEDLCAVLDEVRSWEQTDREHIFLFGVSQGGLVSALTAEARQTEVQGLILQCPAFCIADDWNHRFPNPEDIPQMQEHWGMELGRKFFETLRDLDVSARVGLYRGKVLIIQGEKDPVATLDYNKRAAERYPDGRMVVFSGEGHGFSPENSRRAWNLASDFIKGMDYGEERYNVL